MCDLEIYVLGISLFSLKCVDRRAFEVDCNNKTHKRAVLPNEAERLIV